MDAIDARGFSRSRISSRAIEAYLIQVPDLTQVDRCYFFITSNNFLILVMQILRTGFFHADPHPGNLAIDVDEALIYYDFGMMGEIKNFTRERLLGIFYAVYEKDAKKVYYFFTLML